MQRFMDKNEITHNLMSFSGFKGMLIFTMLVQKPCSYKEIQTAIANNEYLNESISFDTIRIYMNSLKKIGCDIKTIQQGRIKLYYIDNHPFELEITDKQAQSILKLYKAISKSIEIEDFLILKDFFDKIANYITNETLKEKLKKISPLNKINSELIMQLKEYANNNTAITVLYNSSTSGRKNIDILVNKMYISNGKLYIAGINSEYSNYSSFLVSKIIKIVGVNIKNNQLNIPTLNIRYELKKCDNTEFELLPNEKIISESDDKILIEISGENRFILKQRILSLSNRCKVVSPQDFKEEVINCLKKMKEGYIDFK